MYAAKQRGGNSFQFYSNSMNTEVSKKLQLETRLRKALEREEFSLAYQPMINVETGKVVGAEALLRWEDPEMGVVRPHEFVPIAEETGVILPLGEWALRTACAECKAWEDSGLPPVRMGVNVSTRQLTTQTLVDTVAQILRETGLNSSQLELEITESAIMRDDEATLETLEGLREMGIGLALDDFGTGYSSLSYLRRFPISRVKIDRSFIQEIPENADDMALTSAIIAMAHNLGLTVVAEGVETAAQEDFLRASGCDELQGYHLGRPVTPQEFRRLLENGDTR
jgi:EAL domain-containing protein (putative c-di-GMP-specific phosphodiesterase class I)